MSTHAQEISQLAATICGILGSTVDGDVEAVAAWLVAGGDAGEGAEALADKFDEQQGLPSRSVADVAAA